MDSCKIFQDLLPLYLEGLTSPETAAWMEEHRAACPACRRLAEELERPAEAAVPPAGAADFRRGLRAQCRRLLLGGLGALLAGVLLGLAVLQATGRFSLLERLTSPDGAVTAAVYRGDGGHLYLNRDRFTLVHESGPSPGTTGFAGAWGGMWFSPSGRYLLVEAVDEGGASWLTYFDYREPEVGGVTGAVEPACRGEAAFAPQVKAEGGWKDFSARFLEWHPEEDLLLFAYTLTDSAGAERGGYFWLDIDGWTVTPIVTD